MSVVLDFERPAAEIRTKLDAIEKQYAANPTPELDAQRIDLRRDFANRTQAIYRALSPWQTVQVARHPLRPQSMDYAIGMCTDFVEFHGDRVFGDDRAIVGGPARIDGRPVMLVGQHRGRETRERVERNFGSPHPEGYRKAHRLFELAEKFGMPVVTLMDTPGASPGLGDEERGQGWALAANLATLATLRVPVVCVVIGEGNSGGALAIGVGDRFLMLEHSIFSVASPEAAASIVWKDAKFAPQAADALKLTAPDLLRLNLIDRIISEPVGGAHADPSAMIATLRSTVAGEISRLETIPTERLVSDRYEKYRRLGSWFEMAPPAKPAGSV